MPDAPPKAAERWWARFLGGHRHPSQGVAHPDISGEWFTAEHKYRDWEKYNAEFKKAVAQHDINRQMDKEFNRPRIPLLCLTLHGGVGQNARRFLVIEVFPKDRDIVSFLTKILNRIQE